jgi:hypothetical protein
VSTEELIIQLRDKERNPPDMAWRKEIATRLEVLLGALKRTHELSCMNEGPDMAEIYIVSGLGLEDSAPKPTT